MNPENATNASASATTSGNVPSGQSPSASGQSRAAQSDNVAARPGELEYLQAQAAQAKAAVHGAFVDLKNDLARGADPRQWVKTHPWITLASAAAAGFAAAFAFPTEQERALRKVEAIERALHESPETPHANGNGSAPAPERQGFAAMIIHELIGVIRPILLSLASAALQRQPQPSAPPPPADGAGPAESKS